MRQIFFFQEDTKVASPKTEKVEKVEEEEEEEVEEKDQNEENAEEEEEFEQRSKPHDSGEEEEEEETTETKPEEEEEEEESKSGEYAPTSSQPPVENGILEKSSVLLEEIRQIDELRLLLIDGGEFLVRFFTSKIVPNIYYNFNQMFSRVKRFVNNFRRCGFRLVVFLDFGKFFFFSKKKNFLNP